MGHVREQALAFWLREPGVGEIRPVSIPAGKGKPDRLYIAFRENGRWGTPIDMGDALNSYEPWGSHLGPDHRTLYFTSDHALPGSTAENPTAKNVNHIWSVALAPWLQARRADPIHQDAAP